MKKNTKRLFSLLLACAVLLTSPAMATATDAGAAAPTDAAAETDAAATDDVTLPDAGTTDSGAQTNAGAEPDAGTTDGGTQSGAGATDAGAEGGETQPGGGAAGSGTQPGAGTTDAGAEGNGAQPDAGINDAGAEGNEAQPDGGTTDGVTQPGAGTAGTGDGGGTEEKTPDIQGDIKVDTPEDEGGKPSAPVQGDVILDENNDDVQIKKNDTPYLSLGADLTDEQRNTVLSIMGIDASNLSTYDVVYVTNAEEHQYLDAYVDAAKIGSRSLSSVLIVKRGKGSGLNISSNNITFCTVGMYKNALTTAGITDADIIVAGPSPISGTAALVGIIKAYQEMTGESIDENVMDAALHELVITGQLEESIAGLSNEEVEEFIAYVKSVIAKNDLKDEASINEAIDEACERYGVTLSDSERQQIVDLLLKITSLGIDLNGLVDYAASLYNSFKNGESGGGIFSSIGDFFSNAFSAIADFFKGLFS